MMIRQVYNIENKTQLLINIPDSFKKSKQIVVFIDDSVDHASDKMKLMKKAAKDPLFQSDIQEIISDFKHIESENL